MTVRAETVRTWMCFLSIPGLAMFAMLPSDPPTPPWAQLFGGALLCAVGGAAWTWDVLAKRRDRGPKTPKQAG